MSDPGAWGQVPPPAAPGGPGIGPAGFGPAGFGAGGEPPLDRPWYGAPFRGAVRRFWRKYATFSGRASRSEFWWWQLAAAIIGLAINLVYQPLAFATVFRFEEQAMRSPETVPPNPFAVYGQLLASPAVDVLAVVSLVWLAVTIVPTLALAARRLHDAGFRAWWLLLYLVPGGSVAVFVMAILETRPEGARFDV